MRLRLLAILTVTVVSLSIVFQSNTSQAQETQELTPESVVAVPDFAAIQYTLLNLPPDDLIKIAFSDFGPPVVEKFLYIACREGGLDKGPARVNGKKVNPCLPQYRLRDSQGAYGPACSAKSKISSASGMFQFLDDWAGYAGHPWANIVGPDCYHDVMMAKAVYINNGFGPWE